MNRKWTGPCKEEIRERNKRPLLGASQPKEHRGHLRNTDVLSCKDIQNLSEAPSKRGRGGDTSGNLSCALRPSPLWVSASAKLEDSVHWQVASSMRLRGWGAEMPKTLGSLICTSASKSEPERPLWILSKVKETGEHQKMTQKWKPERARPEGTLGYHSGCPAAQGPDSMRKLRH